jgi:SAM-dependent methyltransferase
VSNAIFCQTGFDECSALLTQRLPAEWTLLDHFDPQWMTEPSIRRARLRCPPAEGTISAPFDAWPTPSASTDLVIGMLAIHELRSEAERARWFTQARRALRPGGRVVIAEHVRDAANFLAFGPGALHFHSPSSWQRSWEAASLRARDEFRVTPWVRIFVLEAQ